MKRLTTRNIQDKQKLDDNFKRKENIFINTEIEESNVNKEGFIKYIEDKMKKKEKEDIIKNSSGGNKNNKLYIPSEYTDVYENNFGGNSSGNLKIGNYEDTINIPIENLGIKKQEYDSYLIEQTEVIAIESVLRNKTLYPDQNNFKTTFGKVINQVKKIELVSTEIPNTDQVITDDPISIQNNLFTWENEEDIFLGIYNNVSIETIEPDTVDINIPNHYLDKKKYIEGNRILTISNSTCTPSIDGVHVFDIIDSNTIRINYMDGINFLSTATVNTGIPNYTVSLTPGNYNAKSLGDELQKQLNLVKRRNRTGIYHFFEVSVNIYTDIISIQSVILTQLGVGPLSTLSGSGIITVNQLEHGYKTGDLVKIVDAKQIGGIPANVLNGNFIVTLINSNSFSYEVNERANETTDGGGTTVKTGEKAPFRILFESSSSLLVNIIGYPNEDSSEKIINNDGLNVTNPITTKSFIPSNLEIIDIHTLRITTPIPHGLEETNIFDITNISVDTNPIVTTNIPHLLTIENRVYITDTDTLPKLEGTYNIRVTSPTTFKILDQTNSLVIGGTTGKIKYGGDTVVFYGMDTLPKINKEDRLLPFFVENVTTTTFDINIVENLIYLNEESISETVIGTSQLIIEHPLHGFNTISSIEPLSSTKATITTLFNHNLNGTIYELVNIETIVSDTVDITIIGHGLTTSDTITITSSTSSPNINGERNIQVIDINTIRINLVGGIVASATATVSVGDVIVITNSNSEPKIVLNSLNSPRYNINVTSSNTFEIITGYPITTAGTYGIIGRDLVMSLYRVEAETKNSIDIASIPVDIINNHYYKVNLIDENHYMIRLLNHHSDKTITAGGSSVCISSSLHGFREFQYNTVDGTEDTKLYRSIKLSGEDFIYFVIPGIATVITPGNEFLGDVFAKILLTSPPNTMNYNTFISAPKIYNPPLATFNELEIFVKRKDNVLYNFHNIDFSFSLKVTYNVDILENSYISSGVGKSIYNTKN
jgi:hypothetical protein